MRVIMQNLNLYLLLFLLLFIYLFLYIFFSGCGFERATWLIQCHLVPFLVIRVHIYGSRNLDTAFFVWICTTNTRLTQPDLIPILFIYFSTNHNNKVI